VDRTERRKTGPSPSGYANEPEVAQRDATLLETPAGRENDCGAAEHRSVANREIAKPGVGTRPRSEISGEHDDGVGANETKDGLDERSEDARRTAEDLPTGAGHEGREDRVRETPVFERGLSTPKV
jgi:hypothetical protein